MKIISKSAIIESSDSVSAAINLGQDYQPEIYQVLSMQMPSAWTTAFISFQVSYDNKTFVPLYWNNGLYQITTSGGAAASTGVALEPSAFAGWPYVKVVSGVPGSLINQAAKREIIFVMGNI